MAQTISTELSTTPGGIPPVIHLSQYDKGSRVLSLELYDENGAYSIPSGSTVTIRGTKPDHTGFEYSCTYSGSTVTVTVQDQMTAVAGNVPCEVRITGSDGSILGTANFTLLVKRSALASDVTVSKTDLPLVEGAQKAALDAEESKNAALNSQNAARQAANDAESAKNAAASSASAAAASETAAKASETAAASSASAAAQSEKNAMSATPDGYQELASTFNALGLYVDEDGDICQKDD